MANPQYTSISTPATGDLQNEQSQTVSYKFDRFEIEVRLTPSGQMIGITGVRVNTDFLSHSQNMARLGTHNVEDYYREEKD
jgi:hypothetical protein